MATLLIIADDLTGAVDVGVQLAKQGIPSLVTIDCLIDFASAFRRFSVVVVDSETRHLPAAQARFRVGSLATRARQAGVECLYKKTDSTLRGNVGSELEGLLEAAGARALPFVPALPHLGRTTVGGVQMIHGQPLHQTDFARDPRNPIRESNVAAILRAQTGLPVQTVGRDDWAAWFQNPPCGIAVFDAATEADLKRIALALRGANLLGAVAGTAALAEWLPEVLEFRRVSLPPPVYEGPMLLVCGSLNPVSLRQAAFAEAAGWATVVLAPETLTGPEPEFLPASEIVAGRVSAWLQENRDVLVRSATEAGEYRKYLDAARRTGANESKLPEQVALRTGALVREVLRRTDLKLLSVFGGDTLIGIARAMEWRGFHPVAELDPGVTVSTAAEAPGLTLISKAGGFGGEDLVLRIREKTRG